MSSSNADNDHCPDTLYKYFKYGDWFFEFLLGNSIKFSSRLEFNDPFDCRPAYKSRHLKSEIASYETLAKIRNISIEKRELEKQNIRDKSNFQIKNFENLINETLDKVGVLCVTEKWDNFLMWSHYADNHRGVCVGFKSDTDIFSKAIKVNYQEEKPIIAIPVQISDMESVYRSTYQTKAKFWETEKEWRVLKKPFSDAHREHEIQYTKRMNMNEQDAKLYYDHNGAGFYKFCNSAIQDITLGALINPIVESQIFGFVQELNLDIVIYKAQLADYEYSVLRKEMA